MDPDGGNVTTLVYWSDSHYRDNVILNGADLYWLDSNGIAGGGGIKKAPRLGGATVTLAEVQNPPTAVAVGSTSVYFGANDKIMKITPK